VRVMACSDMVACSPEAVAGTGTVDRNFDQHEIVMVCCLLVPWFQSSKTSFAQVLVSAWPCCRNSLLASQVVALAAR
jgi:hypothetical protein